MPGYHIRSTGTRLDDKPPNLVGFLHKPKQPLLLPHRKREFRVFFTLLPENIKHVVDRIRHHTASRNPPVLLEITRNNLFAPTAIGDRLWRQYPYPSVCLVCGSLVCSLSLSCIIRGGGNLCHPRRRLLPLALGVLSPLVVGFADQSVECQHGPTDLLAFAFLDTPVGLKLG